MRFNAEVTPSAGGPRTHRSHCDEIRNARRHLTETDVRILADIPAGPGETERSPVLWADNWMMKENKQTWIQRRAINRWWGTVMNNPSSGDVKHSFGRSARRPASCVCVCLWEKLGKHLIWKRLSHCRETCFSLEANDSIYHDLAPLMVVTSALLGSVYIVSV